MKWACPECNKVTTKYEILCEHCDYKKSFGTWLVTTSPIFVKLMALIPITVFILMIMNTLR